VTDERRDNEIEDARLRIIATQGPGCVDQLLRIAFSKLWELLPKESRNIEFAEKEYRRLVERAYKHLDEDSRMFGIK
jgi:hypothetical protein